MFFQTPLPETSQRRRPTGPPPPATVAADLPTRGQCSSTLGDHIWTSGDHIWIYMIYIYMIYSSYICILYIYVVGGFFPILKNMKVNGKDYHIYYGK